MAVVYGLVFPLVVHAASSSQILGAGHINNASHYTPMHTLAALLASVGVYLGWRAVPSARLQRYNTFFSGITAKTMVPWLFVMLTAAFVAQYLYTIDYGGFTGYFAYNRLIRSSLFNTFERSRYSFLLPFGDFAVLACLCFWGLLVSRARSASIWGGFILSLMLATYVEIASAGRVYMVTFAALFPMSILLTKRLPPMFWYVGFFCIIIVGMASLYFLSNFADLKGADSLSDFVTREASFPFVSFFAELNGGPHFGLFKDVFLAPAYLAPSSMTNDWLFTASDINTELVVGARKGLFGVTGAIPTDMLTYGLMQFHILGVFIYAILFGILLRVASAVAQSFRYRGLSNILLAYVMLKIGVFGIFYAYPKHYLMTHFAIVVTLLAIWGFGVLGKVLPRRARLVSITGWKRI